jgi:hypothetical protein
MIWSWAYKSLLNRHLSLFDSGLFPVLPIDLARARYMTLRATRMSGLRISALWLVCLLWSWATPVMADLMVKPKDSLGFEPQADQSQGAAQPDPPPEPAQPLAPTVQQDARPTPPATTPATTAMPGNPPAASPRPATPTPSMIQMQTLTQSQPASGGNSNTSGEMARQVLQMLNSYSRSAPPTFPLSSDAMTEGTISYGGYCPNGECYKGARNSGFRGIDTDKMSFGSTGNACRDRILKGARDVAAKYRHSRSAFKGKCALAVRTALEQAGLNKIGALGDAKDMGPNLKRLGFVNKMTSSNPDDAPEGAILVYGAATRPFCTGLGSLYGHVEVKDFNGLFQYDGTATHNIQKRFGSDCRPLIGVYLPGPELEKSC